ncbi:hypothetical protein F4780DRAFT_700393 [Xylariomycetidae sp. FL0641]|nr:hypothetical protein F4780DRAFT_700393 [Xylariomycetidae sp. FL0641]
MPQPKFKPSTKARDPPPSLFLHPSPATSHASLPGTAAPGSTSNAQNAGGTANPSVQSPPSLTRTGSLLNPRHRMTRQQTADTARTADKTDALWAEMQATLEEVELSASGGTHVFGPEHDRKLAELRAAQIALAQAWARSEADDASPASATVPDTNLKGALGELGGTVASATLGTNLSASVAARTAADGTDGGASSARPGSSGLGGESLGAKLEEETERDILMARNRREANDRYFSKVDQGVRDVAAKLEEVAMAMRAVEQETRDVWGDESAPDTSAKAH